MTEAPLPIEPPPIRTHRLGSWVLVALGIGLVPLLIFLAIRLDESAPTAPQDTETPAIIELIAPRSLTEAQIAEAQVATDFPDSTEARAGWIQVVDQETGTLAQRYRFERLDPNPPGRPEGWFHMEQPQAEIHLARGRIITLTGDEAEARAPNQALESGSISGHVSVRLFEASERGPADPTRDEPSLHMQTEEAWFDSVLGEVRCPRAVRVDSPTAELAGTGVTLQFNDRDNRIQLLRFDSLDYVRLQTQDTAVAEPAPPEPGPTAAPSRSATAPTPDASPGAAPEPDYYLLTLRENVVVRQGQAPAERQITGDELTIVFSSEGTTIKQTPTKSASAPATSASRWESVARLAVASVQTSTAPARPEPGPGEAVITCSGEVTMVPLPTTIDPPASPKDAVITMRGRTVRLTDSEQQAGVECRMLVYHSLDRMVRMEGTEIDPLAITLREGRATGRRFWVDLDSATGGFTGPGELILTGSSVDSPPTDGHGAEIRWAKAVNLTFDPAGEGRTSWQLRTALFEEAVRVVSDDLDLTAESMTVRLSDGAAGEIESIEASGAVRVVSRSDQRTLGGERLTLLLDKSASGRILPTELRMKGDVQAESSALTLWSEELLVHFVEVEENEQESEAGIEPRASARVETITADRAVQVKFAEGARAFGEHLVVDALAERATLSAPDLLLVHDQSVIDGGTSVELDGPAKTGRWPGGGRFRSFTHALLAEAPGRLERPMFDDAFDQPQIDVSWGVSMVFDQTVNDGAGAVDLFGDVVAVTRQSPRERSTMEGQQLTLEFVMSPEVETPSAEPSATSIGDGGSSDSGTGLGLGGPGGEGERTLARLVARDGARLESRTWSSEEQSTKPRVFYVAGEQVEYDALGSSATVLGDGTLLIRDEETEAAAESTSRAPFSAKGITMFRFQDRLHLHRLAGDEYELTMSGDVSGSHKGLDGTTSTMTGQRLEVEARRLGVESDPSLTSGLEFGGQIDLKRMRMLDRVYIRTPERRVECDELDYDVRRGEALLRAYPGRTISMLTTSQGRSVSAEAEAITWDLLTDTIRVVDPTVTQRQ